MKRSEAIWLTSIGTSLFALALLTTSSPLEAQMMQLEKETLPELNVPESSKESKNDPEPTVTPCMAWIDPHVKPKAFLLCVHGLGLHKGTYKQFGERMAKLGWGVYAMDVRGFGSFQEIPGKRSVDFPGCMADVRNALEFVHKAHPGKAVFLVGESMGGAIALQMAASSPDLIDGLITSVPAGERHHQVSDSVRVGLHLLAGPKKSMDIRGIVVDRSTQKADLRDEWLHDSLGRFSLSPVELIQFQKFMSENHSAAAKITKTPVLMLQGHSDQLVKLQGQESLINEIPSKDSVLVWVDNAEHLILEEGQFDDAVIQTLSQWLDSHIPANAANTQKS